MKKIDSNPFTIHSDYCHDLLRKKKFFYLWIFIWTFTFHLSIFQSFFSIIFYYAQPSSSSSSLWSLACLMRRLETNTHKQHSKQSKVIIIPSFILQFRSIHVELSPSGQVGHSFPTEWWFHLFFFYCEQKKLSIYICVYVCGYYTPIVTTTTIPTNAQSSTYSSYLLLLIISH